MEYYSISKFFENLYLLIIREGSLNFQAVNIFFTFNLSEKNKSAKIQIKLYM